MGCMVLLSGCGADGLADAVTVAESGSAGADEGRQLCSADAGDVGTRTGLRAQQFLGPGPKRRLVSWQSPDWDIPEGKTEAQLPGEGPRLAVKISWRVSIVNGAAESTLESLKVRPREIATEDLAAASDWEVLVVDGEQVMLPVDLADGQMVGETTFASEATGTLALPGLISEAMGGVNGGRFTVRLLDGEGYIIADRDIRPLRGYEFKEQAAKALNALDVAVASPQGCLRTSRT
jgi:hypothetical protein